MILISTKIVTWYVKLFHITCWEKWNVVGVLKEFEIFQRSHAKQWKSRTKLKTSQRENLPFYFKCKSLQHKITQKNVSMYATDEAWSERRDVLVNMEGILYENKSFAILQASARILSYQNHPKEQKSAYCFFKRYVFQNRASAYYQLRTAIPQLRVLF